MEFSSKDPFPEPCSKNTPKFILILGKNKTHKVFLNYGKYTYTNTYIAIFAPFAYLVPKEAEECDRSPGQGFRSSSKPSDAGASIQTWVPNSSFTTEADP